MADLLRRISECGEMIIETPDGRMFMVLEISPQTRNRLCTINAERLRAEPPQVDGAQEGGEAPRLEPLSPRRMLRFEEVRRRVGYTRAYLIRLEKQGKFPKRVKLGNNSVAWLESDIEEWLSQKVAAST